MYPGTIVNWIDQSAIRIPTVEAVDNSPLYLLISSFDRGPEELNIVSTKFYDLYGSKMNFDKHGQPAIQAAHMIDNGARLLVKRLVADDAKLANLIAVATVNRQITALNTTPDDPEGKTIEEILGEEPVHKEYAEEITIKSTVGSVDNYTVLNVVSPEITSGNSYYWQVSQDDKMPELNTLVINAEYTFWDGTSEIYVVDGTKIRLVEANELNEIKRCGIITVVSKIPHPGSSSIDPETDLPAGVATSREGANIGDTNITINGPLSAEGNEYFYSTTANMPTNRQIFTADDLAANWTSYGAELPQAGKDITVTDGTNLVFVEFEATQDDNFIAVKGFTITACSKLEPDTRDSDSISPIIPTADKYRVASSTCTIKWTTVAASSCSTLKQVQDYADGLLVSKDPDYEHTETGVIITTSADYPLICMGDNGRGLSNKSFKIYADNTVSKDMNTMYYVVNIFDGTEKIEKITVALDPSATHNNSLYGINSDSSIQVRMFNVEGAYEQYVEALHDITGIKVDDLNKYNLITATNSKGEPIPGVTIASESVDLGAAYGVNLKNGDNGAFGDAPFGTDAYIDQAVNVLEGLYDDAIWDVDLYKIAAIFDANYPMEIKNAIAKFVEFREDCVFFRDYGLDVDSYSAIIGFYKSIPVEHKNRYIADYYTTYQIFNPETKKRIKVTMLYDLAAIMINHFLNGCYRPVAGSANDMILPSAIEGTINFTPRITPSVNQKALLDDARINYAIFENGVCVVQSTYSSQIDFTQLSFINNVLAVQEVIRAIRVACPKTRYTFTTDSDFSLYADDVNSVLLNFQQNFAQLTFEYEVDPLQAVQKIFYAELYFRFNNWAQTEKFDIYTLGNE